MANGQLEKRTGQFLNVSLSTICGGDRAIAHLEPVHATLLQGGAHKMAGAVKDGMVEIEGIQATAYRENGRLSEDDLAKLAISEDVNGDGKLGEMTPGRLFHLLRAVSEARAA